MSMYVLDTDMLTLWRKMHPTVLHHLAQHSPAAANVTVITVDEEVSGWYSLVRRAKTRQQLSRAYLNLAETAGSYGRFQILSFTEPAILRFEGLKRQKLGVGSMDLRIAAIVLENSAILVTRNRRDFGRV